MVTQERHKIKKIYFCRFEDNVLVDGKVTFLNINSPIELFIFFVFSKLTCYILFVSLTATSFFIIIIIIIINIVG